MDYLEFYNLTEEPFSQAPNLRFYYNSAQHSRAALRLMNAVDTMKGLAVLLGEIGAGKTILARRMLDSLPEEEYESALLVIIHSQITADWLLTRIARQLGIENPAPEKLKLLNQLYNRLIELHEKKKKAVVLVDEAQMLRSKDIMEEFRGLLNLEMDGNLITFVLFGLPELDDHLHLDEPLAQRVAVKCRLESFNPESAEGYINHRLRMAGAKTQLFTSEALNAVHTYSRGIPRLINTMCDNCLFEGYLLKQKTIDETLVKSIASDLGLVIKPRKKEEPRPVQPSAAPAQPLAAPVSITAPRGPAPAPTEAIGDSTEAELEKAINRAVKEEKEAEETEELDKMLDQIIETGKGPAQEQAKPGAQQSTQQKPPAPEPSEEEEIDSLLDNLDEK